MKKREKLAIIHQYYPHAKTTIDGVNQIIDFVETELDLEPSQVMLADSICSDDVNSIQYPARAHEFLGPFKMGGLNGFPFTGLTGMGAFASHVPDDGAVLIFYGPHIGVSKQGHKNSGCCGAAKAALKKLTEQQIQEGNVTELDYQMNSIEQIFLNQQARILNAKQPLYEATEVMYEAIDKRINELVEKTNYQCKYVILMGAVLINSDSDMGSFSSLKRMEVMNVSNRQRTDFLQEFVLA
jgi:hypothetical protein